jgi:hypothetical protein
MNSSSYFDEGVRGLLGGSVLGCCWAALLGFCGQVSPGNVFLSHFFYSFSVLFLDLNSDFNSNFNCKFLTLLFPLSCIAVIVKPFFPFGTSIYI